MEWISNFISFLKLPIKTIFVIFLVSAFFIFSPAKWLEKLNVLAIKKSAGPIIGVVFLLSISFLIVQICGYFYQKRSSSKKIIKRMENQKESIDTLDSEEKSIIREFYIFNSNSLELPIHNPSVARLISKGFLIQVSSSLIPKDYTLYGMFELSDEVKKSIRPEHIDLKSDQKDWLLQNRPKFTQYDPEY